MGSTALNNIQIYHSFEKPLHFPERLPWLQSVCNSGYGPILFTTDSGKYNMVSLKIGSGKFGRWQYGRVHSAKPYRLFKRTIPALLQFEEPHD